MAGNTFTTCALLEDILRFFGGSEARTAEAANKIRVARHSSGWAALRTILQEQEGLRALDIGPTSSTNINLLTGMGHSVYMADLVTEAKDVRWVTVAEDGARIFRAEDFLDENLALGDRPFDIVLFWDCADFLPPAAVEPLIARLHSAMSPKGHVLVFSRIKPEGSFSRYHLRQDADVDVQTLGDLPVANVYSNRQLENLFARFGGHRFFLAKDNLREVLVTR